MERETRCDGRGALGPLPFWERHDKNQKYQRQNNDEEIYTEERKKE